VGARQTHWWCPVLLNALCKSLTCKFTITISISIAADWCLSLSAGDECVVMVVHVPHTFARRNGESLHLNKNRRVEMSGKTERSILYYSSPLEQLW